MKTGQYAVKSLGYATLPGGDFGDLLKIGNDDQTVPRAHFVAALVRMSKSALTSGGKRAHVMRSSTTGPRQATPTSANTVTLDCTNGATTGTISGWSSHPVVTNDYVFLSFNKFDDAGGIAGQTSGWFQVASTTTNQFVINLQVAATATLTSYPCVLRLGNQYSVSGATCTVTARNHPYSTVHTVYAEFTALTGSAPPSGYYPVKTTATGTMTLTLPSTSYNGATGKVQLKQYHMSLGVDGNISTNLRKAFLHRAGIGTNGDTSSIAALDDWTSGDRPFNYHNGQVLSPTWVNLPLGDNTSLGFTSDTPWFWLFAWGTDISGVTLGDTNLTFVGSNTPSQATFVGTMMPNIHHLLQAHGYQLNVRSGILTPLGYRDLGSGTVYPDVITNMSHLLGNEVLAFDIAKYVSVTSRSISSHEAAMLMQGVSPWDMGFKQKGDFSLNFDSLASANVISDVPVSVVTRGGAAISWTTTGGPTMQTRIDGNKTIDEVAFV